MTPDFFKTAAIVERCVCKCGWGGSLRVRMVLFIWRGSTPLRAHLRLGRHYCKCPWTLAMPRDIVSEPRNTVCDGCRSRHTRSAGPIRRYRQYLVVVFYRPSAFFGVFLLRLAAFNHPPFVRHFFPNGPLSVCSCSLRGLGQLSSEVTRCNQQIRHHT